MSQHGAGAQQGAGVQQVLTGAPEQAHEPPRRRLNSPAFISGAVAKAAITTMLYIREPP